MMKINPNSSMNFRPDPLLVADLGNTRCVGLGVKISGGNLCVGFGVKIPVRNLCAVPRF
jgi:hypothetical protein